MCYTEFAIAAIPAAAFRFRFAFQLPPEPVVEVDALRSSAGKR